MYLLFVGWLMKRAIHRMLGLWTNLMLEYKQLMWQLLECMQVESMTQRSRQFWELPIVERKVWTSYCIILLVTDDNNYKSSSSCCNNDNNNNYMLLYSSLQQSYGIISNQICYNIRSFIIKWTCVWTEIREGFCFVLDIYHVGIDLMSWIF